MSPMQKIIDEESQLKPRDSGQKSTLFNGEASGVDEKSQDERKQYDSLVSGSMKELLYKYEGNTILNLATLQRMVLFRLQERIIEKVGKLSRFNDPKFDKKHPLDSLNEDLSEYSKSPETLQMSYGPD